MKQKTGRKLLSFLLTLAMVLGLLPGMGLTAYAADEVSENISLFASNSANLTTISGTHYSVSCGYMVADDKGMTVNSFGALTINARKGETITKVILSYSEGGYRNTLSSSIGTFDGNSTITGINAQQVSISSTSTAGVKISAVTVYFEGSLSNPTVTLTGGANATSSGGLLTQRYLPGAMDTVTYTALTGASFPEFENFTQNGVTVERTSDTVVTVSGTPTANTAIIVPDAVSSSKIVTWNSATISSISSSITKDYTYTASDITLNKTGRGKFANNSISGYDSTASFEFTTATGKFTNIEIAASAINNGGNWTTVGNTLKWNGTPSNSVSLSGNGLYLEGVSSINFVIEMPTVSVTITPGSNMTKTTDSGAASQTDLSGAMTDVVYTADDGYYFPEDYSVAAVNGISVTRNSYTQITVSGTPTADAAITLTAPTAKTTPDAPTTAAATDCTTADNNDGKLTGVTTEMEYQKQGDTEWTAGTGNDITGLVPGTYYVRIKATDTTNASENQELTVNATSTVAGISITINYGMLYANNERIVGSYNGEEATFFISGTVLTNNTGKKLWISKPTDNINSPTWQLANGESCTLDGNYYAVTADEGYGETSSIVFYKYVPVTGIEFTSSKPLSVAVGEEKYVLARTIPADATRNKVSYTSSNEEIAKITEKYYGSEYYVTGVSVGTATITATSVSDPTKTTTYTVTVTSASAPATVKTAPTAKTLTYTGTAQELVTAGSAEGGEMQYALGTNATTAPTDGWKTDIPTGTDAKTYYVWYKAVGSDGESAAAYVTVTISAASTPAPTPTPTPTPTPSDSSDRDTTPSTPSTPSTTTETKTSETATAADGAAVTTELDASTTTKTNSDGSVTVTDKATETVKTENADGSAIETKTEKTNAETTGSKKNADGSVTDTTKISNTETVTQTATDASGSQTVTETKTEQEHSNAVITKDNADGSKSEKTETTETVKVTEKVTDGSGKVTETVTTTKTETVTDMTAAQDGTATGTSTTTTTVTDDKGNVLSTTVTEAEIKASTDASGMVTTETAATTTTTDAQGNETVEKTVTTENKAPDGSTGTVVKDESGSIVSQSTTISQKEAEAARDEGRPAQSPLTVTPVPEAVENSARSVQVNMPAVLYDKDGDGIVTVAEMPKVEIQVTYSGPGVVAKEKDANGNLTRITECYEGSVIVPVTGTGEIVIVDNTKTFNDVAGSDWYSEYVTFVTAREIFNGTGNGSFAPNETMNRAMLAQVLYNFARGAKAGDGTAFADVSAGDWFNAAVGWAYENGVVTGYGGTFGAQNNITRQDMATILYRYAKQAGYDVSKTASLDKFSDAGDVADYAAEAMRWAVGMGLIEGSDGKLNPTGNATRAQVAAIMTRFVRNAK